MTNQETNASSAAPLPLDGSQACALRSFNEGGSTSPRELPFKPVPGESHLAFDCFLCYFDFGKRRSCNDVARRMGVSATTARRWSYKFKWRERMAAYHEQILRNRIETDFSAKRDLAASWAERARAFKEREWAAAEKLIMTAERVLNSFSKRDPAEVSLAEAARALDIASKLGRLATGLATEHNHTKAEIVSVSLEAQIQSAVQKIYGQPSAVPETIEVESHPAIRNNDQVSE